MTDDDLTPEEIRDRIALLQDQRRNGANQLHARATFAERKPLTDRETAAITRARQDARRKS